MNTQLETEQLVASKVLGRVFYAPNYTKMLPFFKEAHNSLQYSLDLNPTTLVGLIISKYFALYCETDESAIKPHWTGAKETGHFDLKNMLVYATEYCDKVRLYSFFVSPSYYGIYSDAERLPICTPKHTYKSVTCQHDEPKVFAVCRGVEVFHTRDNDCYQTAGGYRSYQSEENPIVYLEAHQNGIYLRVDSFLMVDHYNNNFFGNSTGGGTTKYEFGQMPCVRYISTGLYDVATVLEKYNLTLKKMDCERGKAAYINYES
jgi:hypothetical protein